MVLCNLRIVPEYFCSSGDAHPSVITVDILMVLPLKRVPRKQTVYPKSLLINEEWVRGLPAGVWQGASASARAMEHGRSAP